MYNVLTLQRSSLSKFLPVLMRSFLERSSQFTHSLYAHFIHTSVNVMLTHRCKNIRGSNTLLFIIITGDCPITKYTPYQSDYFNLIIKY